MAAPGSTPPGHKAYVSPAKMQKHYYMSHFTDAEVTDPAVVAMLEKDKTPEKDATIDRPVVVKRTGKTTRR